MLKVLSIKKNLDHCNQNICHKRDIIKTVKMQIRFPPQLYSALRYSNYILQESSQVRFIRPIIFLLKNKHKSSSYA